MFKPYNIFMILRHELEYKYILIIYQLHNEKLRQQYT